MRLNQDTRAQPKSQRWRISERLGSAEFRGRDRARDARKSRRRTGGAEAANLSPVLVLRAVGSAIVKLNPFTLTHSPILFVVEMISMAATLLLLADLRAGLPGTAFQLAVTAWLWLTVLAGTFAEAIAEFRADPAARRHGGARRREKTPGERALTALLAGRTVVFLVVAATLGPFIVYSGGAVPAITLLALAVTLIPVTAGGLLSAAAIAAMDRLARANVVAKSAKVVEICGDVDTLLLDKTGTITSGNRVADNFQPLPGTQMRELVEAAYLGSLGDTTSEGTSIVALAQRKSGSALPEADIVRSISFSADTRMSGADLRAGAEIRKGAEDVIKAYATLGDAYQLTRIIHGIARTGGTPIVVAKDHRILGAIHLQDAIKPAIRERFQQLRRMGVRTVMITGDNGLTAAAIAAEAGVDDVMAEVTPGKKLEMIRKMQAEGRVVAMCGDGADDAPALAQADVGMAMNGGAAAAREAADLIDLDNDPAKLVEAVRIGRELLITRGALTTFSMTSDIAKFIAVLPPLLATVYPGLATLNLMGMHNAHSAVLAAAIVNPLTILGFIPLVLRGVRYDPADAEKLLARNLLIYGLGGMIAPLLGMKAIDMVIAGLGLV
jgi:potassium-transporting ATPase ATP-binding subunit